MPAPLLFMGLPALMALVLLWLSARAPRPAAEGRREQYLATLEAVLAALVVALLAGAAVSLPLDEGVWGGRLVFASEFSVLGRSFVISPLSRVCLALMFGQGAMLFLGVSVTGAGRLYLPAGLAALGLLAAGLFIRPFIFAALFFELAAAAGVLMLVDEAHQDTRGAWRFLVFMTLAMPFVLVAGWLLEGSTVNAADPDFTFKAAVTLSVGFAILLAVVPFQSWVPLMAENAPPLASAFVFMVVQQAIVFLMLTFLNTYPWLQQNPVVYRALTVAGGAMALVGGVFAFGQRNFGRALGYAMLVDIGAVLLGVGLASAAGVAAALATLTLRGLALTLWGMGCEQLRRAAGGDDFDSLRGMARRYPLASAATVLGMLSLVGLPVTAGFPGRWALLRLLAQLHPTGAILLLLGMASVTLVVVRGLAALLMPREDEPAAFTLATVQERPSALLFYGLGLILLLVLGAFPQWVLTAVANAAAVFTSGG